MFKSGLNTFSEVPWEVVGEFCDVLSGMDSDNRPKFSRRLDLAKRTGAQLLVSKLDRLSRDVEFIARTMKEATLKVAAMPNADPFQMHIFAALAGRNASSSASGRRQRWQRPRQEASGWAAIGPVASTSALRR